MSAPEFVQMDVSDSPPFMSNKYGGGIGANDDTSLGGGLNIGWSQLSYSGHGDSGGPYLQKTQNGYAIVAIVSSGSDDPSMGGTSALDMTKFNIFNGWWLEFDSSADVQSPTAVPIFNSILHDKGEIESNPDFADVSANSSTAVVVQGATATVATGGYSINATEGSDSGTQTLAMFTRRDSYCK